MVREEEEHSEDDVEEIPSWLQGDVSEETG
jgi:hypothetical protein